MCYTAQLDTSGLFASWDRDEPFPHFLMQSAAARPVVPALTMESPKQFEPVHWLLVPPWVDTTDRLQGLKIWTANARIEELEQKTLYRPLVKHRRCVVMFTGFYEWRHEDNGTKTRYLLTLPEGEPMYLPGLYARTTIDGAPYTSCTVCTMEARGIMRYVHNSTLRQPVVIPATGIDAWLDPQRSVDQARSAVLHTEVSDSFVPHPPIAAEQELPW